MTDFAAMTVNERLFVAGLSREWDHAVLTKNRYRMNELLQQVQLSDQAKLIVEATLREVNKSH